MWKMKKPHLTERFDRQDCERAAKCRSDNIDARCIANSVSNANRHSRLCNENSPRFLRGCSLGLVPNGLMPSRSTYLGDPCKARVFGESQELKPLAGSGSDSPPAHGG